MRFDHDIDHEREREREREQYQPRGGCESTRGNGFRVIRAIRDAREWKLLANSYKRKEDAIFLDYSSRSY